MSWHHGEWGAFAQASASVVAFFVVLFQHSLHVRHTRRIAKQDRLRDRYRTATYAEALLQNAIDSTVPILNGIEIQSKRFTDTEVIFFDASRLDRASDALGQAIHNRLPTEITSAVLSAWMAAQQLCHALRRTEFVDSMKLADLRAYCGEQFSVLNASLEVIRLSKDKWGKRLNEQ